MHYNIFKVTGKLTTTKFPGDGRPKTSNNEPQRSTRKVDLLDYQIEVAPVKQEDIIFQVQSYVPYETYTNVQMYILQTFPAHPTPYIDNYFPPYSLGLFRSQLTLQV